MKTSLILITFRHLRIAEVGADIGRRRIGLGQDKTVGVFGIDGSADFCRDRSDDQQCQGEEGNRCFIHCAIHTNLHSITDANIRVLWKSFA